jgi:hypothetical protein
VSTKRSSPRRNGGYKPGTVIPAISASATGPLLIGTARFPARSAVSTTRGMARSPKVGSRIHSRSSDLWKMPAATCSALRRDLLFYAAWRVAHSGRPRVG